MSDSFATFGFDGTRYVLTSNVDGAATSAFLAAGTRTAQEHDQTIARLRQDYATIRQWSLDAATTNTNWPTMTQAQKDSAIRETIRRLGVLLDRVGDVLVALNANA